jgi:hypothetical protein
MPAPDDQHKKNLVQSVKDWFTDAADWIQENMAPPELAAAIREDLGMSPASGADAPAFTRIKTKDPDKEAFAESVAAIGAVVKEFVAYGETIKAGDMTGWDAVYLVSRVAASDTMRLSVPAIYAIAKLALFVSDDPEAVEAFTPEVLVNVLTGKGLAPGAGERSLRVLFESGWVLAVILEALFNKAGAAVAIDSYQGWDVAPDTPTPVADRLSQGALSLLLKREDPSNAETLGIGMVPVPKEHGGPGMMLALAGKLELSPSFGDLQLHFSGRGTSGASAFIPFRGGAPGFQLVGGAPDLGLKIGMVKSRGDGPVFRIGDADGTRLEIGAVGLDLNLDGAGAGIAFRLEKAALFLALGGDGFLKQVQSDALKLDFSMGMRISSDGIVLDGGSAAKMSLPVNRSIAGVFKVYSLDLALGPGGAGHDIGTTFSGAFGLSLGPFKATVDQMGLRMNLSFRKGNLGFMDMDLGFQPPKGVGLALDSGPVRGGGYLYIDPDHGSYAGALELKLGPVGVKAIGVLSTRWPDGSDGWSLLLLIYGNFPPIQLSFGFVLTGVGGLIGLQHGIDLDALKGGLSTGFLADVLFPRDPVADAPRIITSVRTVFPPTRYALTIGPMVELGWGTPLIIAVQLGLFINMDNVLGGDRPVSMSKITLVGIVSADLPFRNDAGISIVHLECDFLGYLDFDNKKLGFEAVLRNSRVIGVLELVGGLSIYLAYGDRPAFILSAGGVGPRYHLPDGFKAPPRIGMAYNINVVRVRVETYFTLTPATVQFGMKGELWYGIGDIAEVHGWVGLDALCDFNPFHFRVAIDAGLEAKVFGATIAGIYLKGYVEGPGHWIIDGSARVDLWFTDISLAVHQEWGNPPPELPASTNVAELIGKAVRDPANWSALPPADLDALVSIVPSEAGKSLLAHPLGRLRFQQRVVPFGLKLQKFGNGPLKAGTPDQFDLQELRLNSVAVPLAGVLTEAFARSQFLDLAPLDRLRDPEFEFMPCGIEVGTVGHTIPPQAQILRAPLEYETVDYDEARRRDMAGLHPTLFASQALHGAAAVSVLRERQALRPDPERAARTTVLPPTVRYLAVDPDNLAALPVANADPVLAQSASIVGQGTLAQGKRALVVEAFESLLVGG